MDSDGYERELARIRPLLASVDEVLVAYERAAGVLADACKTCPDKEWVDQVVTLRLIKHQEIERTLEAGRA